MTPTTCNLLVKTDRGNHPIVLGPILIYQTKTFQPFHYFASTLIRLNPELFKLKAFGTDRESELIKAFLALLFGVQKGSNFEAGLIDVDTETLFTAALEHLKHHWNLERSCISPCSDPQFHSWFLKYKASDIKKCVLPAVRVKAGLDPTQMFTTNISESII